MTLELFCGYAALGVAGLLFALALIVFGVWAIEGLVWAIYFWRKNRAQARARALADVYDPIRSWGRKGPK
jgi:hypothetical protein